MAITDPQNLGLGVILISIVLALVVFSFINQIQENNMEACECTDMDEGFCPMDTAFPIEGYLGILGSLFLGIIGVIIFIKNRSVQKIALEKSKRIKNILKTIKGEEKKIYGLIESSDGVILQSDLIQETGYSKVKVSRILDKLEGKGIVERKRRGMSNIVMLKTK